MPVQFIPSGILGKLNFNRGQGRLVPRRRAGGGSFVGFRDKACVDCWGLYWVPRLQGTAALQVSSIHQSFDQDVEIDVARQPRDCISKSRAAIEGLRSSTGPMPSDVYIV